MKITWAPVALQLPSIIQQMKRVLLLVALFVTLGCGSLRHVAVQADAAFAQSVFALTDAALAACQAQVFTPAQCTVGGEVNVKAQQALVDVKAVTSALQDAPKGGLPKNLPDLVRALTDLQKLIGDLGPAAPSRAGLSTKVTTALNQAIALLTAFAGGASL